jgi:2-octaprenyl-6-methoxyphenol hydroxylase
VTVRAGTAVDDFRTGSARVALSLGEETLAAALLVAADGAKSRLRSLAGIRTVDWTYKQVAIVVTVEHERPHHGRAIEHFLPAGPFAVLPLTGNRASLVWTERPAEAERLIAAPPEGFAAALETRFGRQLGAVRALGAPVLHPLGLMLARELVKPRFALIGDAAHTIHPIAGQGLNLGFRDAAAIAGLAADAIAGGRDPGAADVLGAYRAARRGDVLTRRAATDLLNRSLLFGPGVARGLRGVGLTVLAASGHARRALMREGLVREGELPPLMREPAPP